MFSLLSHEGLHAVRGELTATLQEFCIFKFCRCGSIGVQVSRKPHALYMYMGVVWVHSPNIAIDISILFRLAISVHHMYTYGSILCYVPKTHIAIYMGLSYVPQTYMAIWVHLMYLRPIWLYGSILIMYLRPIWLYGSILCTLLR